MVISPSPRDNCREGAALILLIVILAGAWSTPDEDIRWGSLERRESNVCKPLRIGPRGGQANRQFVHEFCPSGHAFIDFQYALVVGLDQQANDIVAVDVALECNDSS